MHLCCISTAVLGPFQAHFRLIWSHCLGILVAQMHEVCILGSLGSLKTPIWHELKPNLIQNIRFCGAKK